MLLRARHLLVPPGTPQTAERKEAVQRYLAENGAKTSADLDESFRRRRRRSVSGSTRRAAAARGESAPGGGGASAVRPTRSATYSSSSSAAESAPTAAAALAPSAPSARAPSPNPVRDAAGDDVISKIEIESRQDWVYLKEKFRRAVVRRAKKHVERLHPSGVGGRGGRGGGGGRGDEGSSKTKRKEGNSAGENFDSEEDGAGNDAVEEQVLKHVVRARKEVMKQIMPILDKWVDDAFDCVAHGVLINGLPYDREAMNQDTDDEGVEPPDDDLHRRAGNADRERRMLERRVGRMRTTFPSEIRELAEEHLRLAAMEGEKEDREGGGGAAAMEVDNDQTAGEEADREDAGGAAAMEVDNDQTADLVPLEFLGNINDAAEVHRRSVASLQRLQKNVINVSEKLARADTVLRDEFCSR